MFRFYVYVTILKHIKRQKGAVIHYKKHPKGYTIVLSKHLYSDKIIKKAQNRRYYKEKQIDIVGQGIIILSKPYKTLIYKEKRCKMFGRLKNKL